MLSVAQLARICKLDPLLTWYSEGLCIDYNFREISSGIDFWNEPISIDLQSLQTCVLLLEILAPQSKKARQPLIGLKMKQKVTGGSMQEFSDTGGDSVRSPAKGDSVSRWTETHFSANWLMRLEVPCFTSRQSPGVKIRTISICPTYSYKIQHCSTTPMRFSFEANERWSKAPCSPLHQLLAAKSDPRSTKEIVLYWERAVWIIVGFVGQILPWPSRKCSLPESRRLVYRGATSTLNKLKL